MHEYEPSLFHCILYVPCVFDWSCTHTIVVLYKECTMLPVIGLVCSGYLWGFIVMWTRFRMCPARFCKQVHALIRSCHSSWGPMCAQLILFKSYQSMVCLMGYWQHAHVLLAGYRLSVDHWWLMTIVTALGSAYFSLWCYLADPFSRYFWLHAPDPR